MRRGWSFARGLRGLSLRGHGSTLTAIGCPTATSVAAATTIVTTGLAAGGHRVAAGRIATITPIATPPGCVGFRGGHQNAPCG
jgi:hypothetical protein